MIHEKYIFALQVVASAFMGLDYFLTEEQRKILHEFLRKNLHKLQETEQRALLSKYLEVKKNILIITWQLGVFSISLIVVLYKIPTIAAWSNRWITLTLMLFFILALISSGSRLFSSILDYGVPAAFSTLKISIARFLIRCPKGAGFGVGFLFLTASLICRGMNIDW